MNRSSSFVKFGVPRPVIGSHPCTAEKPSVKQPPFVPLVMSWKTCGSAIKSVSRKEPGSGIGVGHTLVQYRVDKTNGLFASGHTLLVDERKDRCPDWSGHTCAVLRSAHSHVVECEIRSVGGDIWEAYGYRTSAATQAKGRDYHSMGLTAAGAIVHSSVGSYVGFIRQRTNIMEIVVWVTRIVICFTIR